DVAGGVGLRALLQPSRQPLLRRRQDRARPGRGLCQAQGLERVRGGALARAGAQLRSAGDRANRSGIASIKKTSTGEVGSSPVLRTGGDLALSWDPRTQNAPSKMAPTNTNTAHPARTSSLKARSTSYLRPC